MELTLSWNSYSELWSRVKAFYQREGRFPNYADTQDNKYRILKDDLIDAGKRVEEFIQLNKRNPYNVTVTATSLVERVVGPIQKACEKLLGEFNSITEFCNKCRGRGYGNYYNDIKTLEEEYQTIANLNCVDSTQLLIHLGMEMGGYELHYIHVNCLKSDEGHVFAKVQGREFKTPTYIDLAAMMSTGTMATIGHGWCFDAIPVNGRVDPSWLTRPDDGIT